MRRTAHLIALLLLASSLHAASLERTIDRAVTKTMRDFDIPGLAIAVVQNDRLVLVKGFGIREQGASAPVTATTLFELGSTSKAFTSAAMAMLVGDGKMGWDDPVRNYVPYFRLSDPCADSVVTLRDIVSHRTGLSRHDELWEATGMTRTDLVRAIASLTLSTPIRTAYQYNNIMFVAAGEAIAGASGMTWDQFMRRRFFPALGMNDSRTTPEDWNTSPHATGHSWDSAANRATPRRLIDYSAIAAAGTVKTNAADMSRWLRFQLAGGSIDGRQVVAAAALEETHKPHTIIPLEGTTADANPETTILAYGMGWNVQDYRGERLIAHAGVLNGFRSNVALLPSHGLGIAIMENVGRGYALFSLRNTILDAVLRRGTRDWDQFFLSFEKSSDQRQAERKARRAEKRTPPARPLPAYEGTYHQAAYGDLTITATDKGLMVHWQQLNAPLEPQGVDTFHVTADDYDVDEDLVFAAPAGEITSLRIFGERFERK